METIVATDERDLYPTHEETTVPQGGEHDEQCHYLAGALRAHRPDLLVLHDVCLYWERGNFHRYRAADLSVIAGPRPPRPPRVHLAWQDPPLLFVGEVVSDLTRGEETGDKKTDYEQHLQVPEYLIADAPEEVPQLFRLTGGVYQPVPPEGNGRVWSAGLEVGFGYDAAGFLRIYTRDGTMLLTQEEERQQREEAERRAQAEVERRAEAEQRLAELTAELERLRRQGIGSD